MCTGRSGVWIEKRKRITDHDNPEGNGPIAGPLPPEFCGLGVQPFVMRSFVALFETAGGPATVFIMHW